MMRKIAKLSHNRDFILSLALVMGLLLPRPADGLNI